MNVWMREDGFRFDKSVLTIKSGRQYCMWSTGQQRPFYVYIRHLVLLISSMLRTARVVAKGYPHHVTQRGNYKQSVFEEDNDYVQYLEWLKDYSKKYSLDIWAYCLMANHVHFVCVPKKDDSLPSTFNMFHMRYAQYNNRRKQASSHLW